MEPGKANIAIKYKKYTNMKVGTLTLVSHYLQNHNAAAKIQCKTESKHDLKHSHCLVIVTWKVLIYLQKGLWWCETAFHSSSLFRSDQVHRACYNLSQNELYIFQGWCCVSHVHPTPQNYNTLGCLCQNSSPIPCCLCQDLSLRLYKCIPWTFKRITK